jgi:hypothetical protein
MTCTHSKGFSQHFCHANGLGKVSVVYQTYEEIQHRYGSIVNLSTFRLLPFRPLSS